MLKKLEKGIVRKWIEMDISFRQSWGHKPVASFRTYLYNKACALSYDVVNLDKILEQLCSEGCLTRRMDGGKEHFFLN